MIPGIASSCLETSRVEVDEGSASRAETVAVVAVGAEADADGTSRVEVDAGATACIEVSCVEADAAGLA